ncbi:hypothetical protein [Superficieibacter sp. HKU1]|uniref:hypothetical protein n=1 Tax=Superficieibacter sp. HKU1 TaxID=3031919 RepID=UPI0023E1E5A6|nr:hypothetical protein [Superficieibacter sp. HKU1]WES68025.1 hypothetical protein P0H77_20870 [Superficieibacter sp. HKU1]
MRMGTAAASAGDGGIVICLWTCGRGFERLCRVLTVGNGLLESRNVCLLIGDRVGGNGLTIPGGVAAEIEGFTSVQSNADGSRYACLYLFTLNKAIAFDQ